MGKLYECEDVMKDVKHSLEKMFEVDPLIYSSYYLLSLEYSEKKQNWDEFYTNSIQYLAYVKECVRFNIIISKSQMLEN